MMEDLRAVYRKERIENEVALGFEAIDADLGGPNGDREAFHRWRQAAILGDIESQVAVGMMYFHGLARARQAGGGPLEGGRSAPRSLRAEQMSIEKQLQSLEKAKDKKVQWMIDTLPQGAVAEAVRAEIEKQLESIKQMKIRQEDIVRGLEALTSDTVQAEAVADYLKCFADAFDQLETGQKRVLIQGLVKEVTVNGKDDCSVILTIPLPAKSQAPKKAKKGGPLDESRPSAYPWLAASRAGVHLSAQSGVTEGT